jgi:hypothetical protein
MACSESHGRGTGGRRGIPGYERVTQRGELLASKDARVVYAGFLVLDRADQHAFADALLRELTSRQPRDTPSRRMTEAIRSLREATHTLGEPPTIRQFETLRREHPEWGWPPSSTIRRWLGARAWDEALRLAGLPTPLPGDALEPELGPAFTTREAIEALQQCTQDLGRLPSFNEYHAWAHRTDVIGRPGRRPLSEGPFCRLFGSFQLAIVAAGLAEDARSAVVAGNGNVRAPRTTESPTSRSRRRSRRSPPGSATLRTHRNTPTCASSCTRNAGHRDDRGSCRLTKRSIAASGAGIRP